MINKFFLNILNFFINLIDYFNKKKIINYFKSNFSSSKINIFDIGAHKGETIDLFLDNFNINKIYAFEPNFELFNYLRKKNYSEKKVIIYNMGIGQKDELKKLNIMKDSSSSTFHSLNENSKYFKKKNKILSLFSKKKNYIRNIQEVKLANLSKLILENKIKKIDILKIDTEGYEYYILQGLNENDFKKIKYIYFEHHYDLMINKGYKYSDINKFLMKNNFNRKYKLKMNFRKSFEYIYENTKK